MKLEFFKFHESFRYVFFPQTNQIIENWFNQLFSYPAGKYLKYTFETKIILLAKLFGLFYWIDRLILLRLEISLKMLLLHVRA